MSCAANLSARTRASPNWSGADIDSLLEILNSRRYERELARAIAYAARYSMPAVLMLVGLDDFKPVNDRRGHAARDRCSR